MLHNIPTGNVTSFVDLFSYTNSVTSPVGLFGIMILIAIFIITFSLFARRDSIVAFAMSSWITMISSVFLGAMSGSFGYLIPGEAVAITTALAIISIILLYWQR